uniref:Uncharacterized protein LOC100375844 n=1 Tax=Saccoglossus kowalevskii TaxID=10224 RepID=A0ABM0MV14_SACKO|nr:PREDICTED: uncharacterized protein LOC100375844 [Saccoglossus kowalevskii]
MSLESSTIMYSFIPICYLSFCALLFECDGIVIRNVATDDDMMIQEFTYCNGNVSACMKVPGRICNQDDVLSAYQVQLLENQLSSFQQSTPCPCNDDNCTTRFMMTILLLNELPWNKTDPLYQRKDVAVARMTNTFRIELEKSAKCGENVVIVIVVQEKMVAFWCITRRDKKTSWEYWTSFFWYPLLYWVSGIHCYTEPVVSIAILGQWYPFLYWVSGIHCYTESVVSIVILSQWYPLLYWIGGIHCYTGSVVSIAILSQWYPLLYWVGGIHCYTEPVVSIAILGQWYPLLYWIGGNHCYTGSVVSIAILGQWYPLLY